MATLRDLADQLGVSIATISRALNDKPGVSAETRQQVLRLASELQYRPNLAARNLATSRTQNVLFVIHRRQFSAEEDPFYPYIIQGLEETLSGEGYSVMLVTLTDSQLAAGPETLPALQDHRADAVILAGPDISSAFILKVVASGIPTLLVDNALSNTALPAVLQDNKGGCLAATNHLIETHSHKHIALLRGPLGWISSEERAAGYQAAMEAAGLQPYIITTPDTTIETGQEAANKILQTHLEITAIVAINDAMAIGAIRAANQLEKKVPEDIAIVGFDDISWAAYSDPPLTTVSSPTLEIGRLGGRLLIERIAGNISSNSTTRVATQLVIRESCGCSGRS